MIRFVKRKDVDEQKWNALIKTSWHETAYGYTWYLDALKENWSALVQDDYESVMPLILSKKNGIRYIHGLSFMQYTTIFGKEPKPQLLDAYLQAMPSSIKFIDFNLLLPFRPNIKGAQIKEKTNLILTLSNARDKISRSYNSNTRRNIKKALKYKVEVKKAKDPKLMIDAYSAFKRRKYNTRFSKLSAERLSRIISSSLDKNHGRLLYAWDKENNFLGGTYFQFSTTRMIYLFSATEEKALHTGAMAYIVHYALDNYGGQFDILDFEGSDIEGIARFYKGFGAEPVKYYRVKINRLPWFLRWVKS